MRRNFFRLLKSALLATAAFLLRDTLTSTWAKSSMTIPRSEEHTSELQSRLHFVCRLLLEKKNTVVRPLVGSCTIALSLDFPIRFTLQAPCLIRSSCSWSIPRWQSPFSSLPHRPISFHCD